MDLSIRNLSNKIIEDLNNASNIPIEVKRLILVEIMTKVTCEANKQVEQEMRLINVMEGEDNGIREDSMG